MWLRSCAMLLQAEQGILVHERRSPKTIRENTIILWEITALCRSSATVLTCPHANLRTVASAREIFQCHRKGNSAGHAPLATSVGGAIKMLLVGFSFYAA